MIDPEESRWRLYCWRDGNLVRLADTSLAGVGLTVRTLAEDAWEAGLNPETVFILDAAERRWVSPPNTAK